MPLNASVSPLQWGATFILIVIVCCEDRWSILVKRIHFLKWRYVNWWTGVCVWWGLTPGLQWYLWSHNNVFLIVPTSLVPHCRWTNHISLIHPPVKRFSYPQDGSATPCFYHVLLFLFASFIFTLTNISMSKCLIVLQSLMWTTMVSDLCLTQLSGRKTRDAVMTTRVWERRRATVLWTLRLEWPLWCPCCTFSVFLLPLGSDYFKNSILE